MSLITRRTRGILLCLILAAVARQTFAVSKFGRTGPTDWPQYRGKNRDGISTEKSWLGQWPGEGPKTLWKASVGVGFSAVSVSNGRAITMGNTQDVDTVYCFDALTGRELWRHSYPCLNRPNLYEGGPNSTPTVSDVHVYALSRTGQLFCLEAASGKPVWKKDLQADFAAPMPDWGFTCSPLVVGNMLVVEVGAQGASVVAFKKATGEVLWKSGNDRVAYSSPVAFKLGDDACLACFMAPGLVVLKSADGSEVCRHLWKTSYDVNAATPIITGDRIFLSSG
ncbi:MAG: PQQ-like beta-propeller repeat protein, partial [Armatimonadetes bacterium]|nr:PQQ-like beta-propeller repeat protein [Armatimonadota bacterium]